MQIFTGSKSIKGFTFTHGITEKSKHSQENLQPQRIRNISAHADENVINEYQKTL